MTATYGGDPSASSKDAVRFWIQDTASPFDITDEEIAFVLTLEANPQSAAAQVCRALAAKFAKAVDKKVGDLSISYSDRQAHYLALADQLDAQGGLTGLMPYAGGISLSDVAAVEANTDRPTPAFRQGQFDNPEVGIVGGDPEL